MKRFVVVVVTVALSFLCSDRANAQFVFGVRGDVTSFKDFGHHPTGASLTFGNQMRISYLQVDLGYNRYGLVPSDDTDVVPMKEGGETEISTDALLFDSNDMESAKADEAETIVHRVHLDVALMPRLYGNAKHSFNVYFGAGLTGGLEFLQAPEGVVEEDGRKDFFVGLFPVLEAEAFMTKKLAFFADVRTPYYFVADFKKFEPHCSLGFRMLF